MSGPLGSSQWMYSSGGFYPYEIEQSLRFNDDDSASLYRLPASAGNRKTWTFSAWVKRGSITTDNYLLVAEASFSDRLQFQINSAGVISAYGEASGAYLSAATTAVFRDPSAWYHVVIRWDTTQATAADRLRVYVNGVQQTLSFTTSIPLNQDGNVNLTQSHWIGAYPAASQYFDGYMAEVNFIDGTALDPTSFGEFKSGIWVPKAYTGSYGTNGFYLSFADSAAIGDDLSGNGNDWTPSGLASTDVLLDSPTNNYAVLNVLDNSGPVVKLSDGNLRLTASTTVNATALGSVAIPETQTYFEVTTTVLQANTGGHIGISRTTSGATGVLYRHDGFRYIEGGSWVAYGASYGLNDVVGVAVDRSAGTVTFYKNGVSQGVVSYSGIQTGEWFPHVYTTAWNSTNFSEKLANFGQSPFAYTPPADFLPLNTANLPEPTITPALDDVPADYFNTVLYTGTGAAQSITGVGFQPDWVWIKDRVTGGNNHNLWDAVRGAGQALFSNLTSAEATDADMTGFVADGFTFSGPAFDSNTSGQSYVAWNWKANGAGVANTDGTISSTVSANQKAGFSIVSWTGSGAGATVGHGLGAAPKMLILKNRTDAGTSWGVSHAGMTNQSNYFMFLDQTLAQQFNVSSAWNSAAPDASVFSVGTSNDFNGASDAMIAYCFAEVEGYSKFGSYTGNGSTDGPFVWCGFRPALVLAKSSSVTGSWCIFDAERNTYNLTDLGLLPNSSRAEAVEASNAMDFLSNGFKLRAAGGSDPVLNSSGQTVIFAAWAKNPFKYSNAR